MPPHPFSVQSAAVFGCPSASKPPSAAVFGCPSASVSPSAAVFGCPVFPSAAVFGCPSSSVSPSAATTPASAPDSTSRSPPVSPTVGYTHQRYDFEPSHQVPSSSLGNASAPGRSAWANQKAYAPKQRCVAEADDRPVCSMAAVVYCVV